MYRGSTICRQVPQLQRHYSPFREKHVGTAIAHINWKEREQLLTDTLAMPQTSFPMRGDASAIEKRYRAKVSTELFGWQKALAAAGSNGPDATSNTFVMHDGPPFANGDLHMGHALNKILKDITVRFQLLAQPNQKIEYRPGWDCHGLPIEIKALHHGQMALHLDGSGGTLRPEPDPIQIRQTCRQFAHEAAKRQAASMRDWGLLMDFDHPFYTMDPAFEATQLEIFAGLVEQGFPLDLHCTLLMMVGLIFRSKQPVYWSPSSRSALAEAELEYDHNYRSRSAFVRFKVAPSNNPFPFDNLYLLIWTTTPWTLTANMAIAHNSPHIDYCIAKCQHSADRYIVARKLVERLQAQIIGLSLSIEIDPFRFPDGQDAGTTWRYHDLWNPTILSPILKGTFVTDQSGTGLVHLAPSYGKEDFDLFCESAGTKDFVFADKLVETVSEDGKFNSLVPRKEHLEGLDIFTDGNQKVIHLLAEQNSLFVPREGEYCHAYPMDWRTKKPVFQRATHQWFINVKSIRAKLLTALSEQVSQFYPDSSLVKFENIIKSRDFWCISRQRYWGVPIPAFHQKPHLNSNLGPACILDPSFIRHLAGIVRNDPNGTDCWWTMKTAELIPPTNEPLKAAFLQGGLEKGMDTLDVWFDSGTSWSILGGQRSNVYLEGNDQFRGWFQSSLITSGSDCIPILACLLINLVACNNVVPFRKLVAHGFVLDGNGAKMSKSLGNVIEPSLLIYGNPTTSQKGAAKGIDLLRWWAVSSDFTKDVLISSEIQKTVGESLQKLRNSFRFMLGNISNFRPEPPILINSMCAIDRYLLALVFELGKALTMDYESFQFHKAYRRVNEFIGDGLAIYFDSVKDRLYADPVGPRQSAQSALFIACQQLCSFVAPILPFLAEEVYEAQFRHDKLLPWDDSVFKHPLALTSVEWPVKMEGWDMLKQIRAQFKSRFAAERLRNAYKSTTEIDLTIGTNSCPDNSILNFTEADLTEYFVTSSCKLDDTLPFGHLRLAKTNRHKCPRCWMHWSEEEGHLCARCVRVMEATSCIDRLGVRAAYV